MVSFRQNSGIAPTIFDVMTCYDNIVVRHQQLGYWVGATSAGGQL